MTEGGDPTRDRIDDLMFEELAADLPPERIVRFWRSPTWWMSTIEGRRTIRLILTHPATGGLVGSTWFPADTREIETASKAALTQWANDLAPRRGAEEGVR